MQGGRPCLRDCSRRTVRPQRGVYFFFEAGEERSQSGTGPRVVRVGTHAISLGAKSTLWSRLRAHRGTRNGGNHRGSIFRGLVGAALLNADRAAQTPSWRIRPLDRALREFNVELPQLRDLERPLEIAVSNEIGAMPVLWLDVQDTPGPDSDRKFLEQGAIALLSNWNKTPIDPPSPSWLGHFSTHRTIQASGLWNNQHVDETYPPGFLDRMEAYIDAQTV